uniref:Spermine oxidase n=1 Tax=Cacopsylla melanoneura TaxID=428564 RepID=A0A8D8WJW9_9HEMI
MRLLHSLVAIIVGAVISSVQCTESSSPNNYEYNLIIIGAGPSGIAAATQLVTDGIETDFIILEAQDRIGGRVHTVPYDGNTSIDMGAQFIDGQVGNPVYKMAKEHNLTVEGCEDMSGFHFYNSSGDPMDANDSLKFWEMVEGSMYGNKEMKQYNGSLGDYVWEKMRTDLAKNASLSHMLSSPRFEQLLNYFGKFENAVDASDSWFETSARGIAQYDQLDGCPGGVQWKKGGYGNVFKLLMKQLPGQTQIDLSNKILLNKEVTKINWTDPNVVLVECADGTSYTGDKVLITVSLGVLKTKPDLFVPQLPSWKTNAIENVFFGTLDKIFLRFPHKWWPAGVGEFTGLNFVWTKHDEETLFKEVGGVDDRPWVIDITGFYTNTEDPLTLLGWISGPSARYMETLTDTQVGIDTMKLLRHFFSNSSIPEPTRVVKSTWNSNPHFKGSYSSRSLKTERANTSQSELAKPVINTRGDRVALMFAGEATNPTHYGTVHGAVETGWREADRIVNLRIRDALVAIGSPAAI